MVRKNGRIEIVALVELKIIIQYHRNDQFFDDGVLI
jgi:hypothetical protein